MLKMLSARNVLFTVALALTATVGASEDIAKERSEMMKDVRNATKPVGAMLRGDADFDPVQLQASLAWWQTHHFPLRSQAEPVVRVPSKSTDLLHPQAPQAQEIAGLAVPARFPRSTTPMSQPKAQAR